MMSLIGGHWKSVTLNMSPARWSVLVLLYVAVNIDCSTIHTQTVCNTETFNASCPTGHVILMQSALYGRMELGRCLTTNFSVGCKADVLKLADQECSGRRNCRISIPNSKFKAIQTCRIDLVVFFEAKYRCVPAFVPTRQFCPRGRKFLNATDGYIVFYPAQSYTSCTLEVKAKPGEQVKVTVLDFSDYGLKGEGTCSLQVGFQEMGGIPRHVDGCKQLTQNGESLLYTSHDNKLNITVLPRHNLQEAVLLHYQATGCANPAPPPLGEVERVGDTLKITCNQSREKWHLVCEGDSWVGRFSNCTGGLFLQEQGEGTEDRLSLGLLVAIALGVLLGVFAGFLFLLMAFLCKQSVRRRTDLPHTPAPESRGFHGNTYKMVDVQGAGPEDACYMCYHDYESSSVYMRAGLDVTDRSCDAGHVISHVTQTGSEPEERTKNGLGDVTIDYGCPGTNAGVYRGQTAPRGRGPGEGGEQIYRLHQVNTPAAPVRVQLPSVSVNAELKYS